MNHELLPRTRSLLVATAGTAVVAAADLLDRVGATTWVLVTTLLLLLAAAVLLRAREVVLRVDADELVVQGLLHRHVVPVDDVARITTGPSHTVVELQDGRRITSLLRDHDLVGLRQELPSTDLVATGV